MQPEILERFFQFLRFGSISTQPERAGEVRACAQWLCEEMKRSGLEARLEETGGHPAVLARAAAAEPGRPTILIYGHYDVQPPEPLEEWSSPPFEPVVRDERVFARGATDNKGQLFAHWEGVAGLLREGRPLPANVMFLVEGEEEIGSPHLGPLLERLRGELACDAIVISDTGMVAHGWPTLTYSLRGLAALEVRVEGPATDLHSGVFGGAVMNPATALCRLVASLHDASGHVAIEGFYDHARPLFDWEREAAAQLPVGDADILALTGAPELFGEPGYSAVERIGGRPTAEVNGLGGGYQGEGTKTIIPREAFAKITFRLVPHQKPAEILRLAEEHLRRNCPPGIQLEMTPGHSGEPYYIDPHGRMAQAALRALERAFGRKPALFREGGSIPILGTLKHVLGTDALLLALASPDCRAHAPDENFPLENLEVGIRLHRCVLEEIGALAR